MRRILEGLIFSLALAFLCFALIAHVSATSTSYVLGSKYQVDPAEINNDTSIANLITSYSSIPWQAYNWYGSQTTANNVYTAAAGNGGDYSISFYIGHGGALCYLGNLNQVQYFIIDNNGGQIWDNNIYPYSAYWPTDFVFLWSCEQGNTTGGFHWLTDSYYGMPECWFWGAGSSMSTDGYANPDNMELCFLGFNGSSPFLSAEPFTLGIPHECYNFLSSFYYYALYKGWTYSINQALNQATIATWNLPFEISYIRTGLTHNGVGWYPGGNMVVYGDGAIHISSEGPYPGAGCPLLYVYKGSDYKYQGLLDIHDSSGATADLGQDIIRNFTLNTSPQSVNGTYLLRLVEHPLTQSFIDQVKLFATTSSGKTLQLPLVSAKNDQFGNVLKDLSDIDGDRLTSNANHVTDLVFSALPSHLNATAFIFQIAGRNPISKN